MPVTFIRVAIALILCAAGAAAQAPIETRGAWRLMADGPDLALRTQALDAPDSSLSLACGKEQSRFAFELRSPALSARASGEATTSSAATAKPLMCVFMLKIPRRQFAVVVQLTADRKITR